MFVAKSPAAVRLLAAAGASVNDINYASLTPLHTAKDVGVVQALIELGTGCVSTWRVARTCVSPTATTCSLTELLAGHVPSLPLAPWAGAELNAPRSRCTPLIHMIMEAGTEPPSSNAFGCMHTLATHPGTDLDIAFQEKTAAAWTQDWLDRAFAREETFRVPLLLRVARLLESEVRAVHA